MLKSIMCMSEMVCMLNSKRLRFWFSLLNLSLMRKTAVAYCSFTIPLVTMVKYEVTMYNVPLSSTIWMSNKVVNKNSMAIDVNPKTTNFRAGAYDSFGPILLMLLKKNKNKQSPH